MSIFIASVAFIYTLLFFFHLCYQNRLEDMTKSNKLYPAKVIQDHYNEVLEGTDIKEASTTVKSCPMNDQKQETEVGPANAE